MAHPPQPRIKQHLQRLLEAQGLKPVTDSDLLERFVAAADEAAFAQIVRRHGPRVLAECRRTLRQPADAEDAFQATFLLLARKAAMIRQLDSVEGWLFTVARRMALRLRAFLQRRAAHEKQVHALSPTDVRLPAPSASAELRSTLCEELDRLPEKYRAPLVLCYLERQDRAEAARLLGWTLGAVKIRLERGRALLRKRLSRHGKSQRPRPVPAEGHAADFPELAELRRSFGPGAAPGHAADRAGPGMGARSSGPGAAEGHADCDPRSKRLLSAGPVAAGRDETGGDPPAERGCQRHEWLAPDEEPDVDQRNVSERILAEMGSRGVQAAIQAIISIGVWRGTETDVPVPSIPVPLNSVP
jgi:RNA polymerase sigma factor (sigma-70 family)